MASSNSVLMSSHEKPATISARPASGHITAPSVTGIDHTLLGSRDWPTADQDAACELLRLVPDAVTAAYQHREFVQRAALFLADQAGVSQFVAIGNGLNRLTSLHDLVQGVRPGTRVLYVDSSPVHMSQSPDRLIVHAGALEIKHDVRDPHGLIRHPAFRHLFRPDAPAAILLAGTMHFVPDSDHPGRIVSTLVAAMPPGSYLLLSHATDDQIAPEASRRAREVYRTAGASFTPRSYPGVAAFFAGLDVLPPGVVASSAWRPGSTVPSSRRTLFYAGLARKR
jgi:S-adenosyl methyltransferase